MKTQRGFTLIELMVIIIIIGILAGVTVPKMFGENNTVSHKDFCASTETKADQIKCYDLYNKLRQRNLLGKTDTWQSVNGREMTAPQPEVVAQPVAPIPNVSGTGYEDVGKNMVLFKARDAKVLARDIQQYMDVNSKYSMGTVILSNETGTLIKF